MNYEAFGKFTFNAFRYGGEFADFVQWMAEELQVPRPDPEDTAAVQQLYVALWAKYPSEDEIEAKLEAFICYMKDHKEKPGD